MVKTLTNRDIDDGKKISALFLTLPEEDKAMVIGYLSALKDKEIDGNGDTFSKIKARKNE